MATKYTSEALFEAVFRNKTAYPNLNYNKSKCCGGFDPYSECSHEEYGVSVDEERGAVYFFSNPDGYFFRLPYSVDRAHADIVKEARQEIRQYLLAKAAEFED